jgi:AraC-like DNA-binding protein
MAGKRPAGGPRHAMLDLAAHGLPEVPVLGVHHQPFARAGLSAHLHPGAMEICYLVRGELVFRVAGRDHRMRGNEVFWTRADEEHGSGRHPFGKGLLYWLQLRLPERPRKFLALSGAEAWPLVRALRRLPARHFRGDHRLRALYEEAFRLAERAPAPLGRLALATRLAEWLRLVVECSARRPQSQSGPTDDIRRALDLAQAPAPEPPAIGHLAAAAGLSESRFKAKFRRQMGMPPGEYLLRSRVERAREMLSAGRSSVTEVAHALGFSSSQYFATVFKRYLHRRPSEVRRGKGRNRVRSGGRGRLPAPGPHGSGRAQLTHPALHICEGIGS